MPFDAFKISGIYELKSDATAVLLRMTEAADAANASFKAYSEQMAVVDKVNAAVRRSTLGVSDAVLGFGRNAATGFDAAATSATRTMTVIRREYDATRLKLAKGFQIRTGAVGGVPGGAGGGIGLGGGAAAAAGGGAAGFAARAIAGPAAVGGIAALGTAAVGISAAASTQQSIAQLAVQSGRSIDAINRSYTMLAIKASNRLGMPLADTFSVIREVGGVIKNPVELRASLIGVGKQGGIFDLVKVLQSQGVSTNPVETARDVIRLDHILNAYTASAMAGVNERLYRAAAGSHMELSPLVKQTGYFGEQFRLAAGGRPAAAGDILSLAQLGYWGVGTGKWGSGLGQVLRTMNRVNKTNAGPLYELGLLSAPNVRGHLTGAVENAQGQFTPLAMIKEVIARTYGRGMKPMDIQALINRAFPANAARMVGEATSPKTQAFIDRLNASQAKMPSLLVAEALLMNNLNDQTGRVTKSFQNIANLIEGPAAKKLAGVASHTANKLDSTTTWLSTHPRARDLTANAVNAAAIGTAAWLAKSGFNLLGIGVNASKGEGLRLHTYFSKIFSRGGIAKDVESMFDLVTKAAGKATPRAAGLAGKVGSAGEAALKASGYFGTVFRVLARFNEITLPAMGLMDSYTFIRGIVDDQNAAAKAISVYKATHGGLAPIQNAGGSGFGGVGGRPFEPRALVPTHPYHRERTREVRHETHIHLHGDVKAMLPAGSTRKQADAVINELAGRARSSLRHQGDLPHDPTGFSRYEAGIALAG